MNKIIIVSILAVIAIMPIAFSQETAGAMENQKKAFVVGIGKYQSFSTLANPPNDANLIASSLQSIGYGVHGGKPLIDVTAEQLKKEFLKFAAGLNSQSHVVIYFAGHGLQAGGENLLIPSDFSVPESKDELQIVRSARLQSLQLGEILIALEEASVPLSVLMLDCCRNQGFIGSSSGLILDGGLAAPRKPSNFRGQLLIGFAAKHGETALDGRGQNSPFAEALAKRIVVPGEGLRKVLDGVTSDVLANTNQKQQPHFYSSLTSEVYLAGVPSGIEQLTTHSTMTVGAPKTVSALVAKLFEMPSRAEIQKLLGEATNTTILDSQVTGLGEPVLYESYVTEQYGLQIFSFKDNQQQWNMVTFVVHLHTGNPIPIYRGHPSNTLFVLGQTPVRSMWERGGVGTTPNQVFDTESGRFPALVGSIYLARPGNYQDCLIPAWMTDIDTKAIELDEAFGAFAVGSFDNQAWGRFISRYVGAPISWMEEGN